MSWNPNLKFRLSTLHTRICFLELIFHVSYKLNVKNSSKRSLAKKDKTEEWYYTGTKATSGET